MEGVITPEIWIAVAGRTGLPELQLTTRDEPDYQKLMNHRISVLGQHDIGLNLIQEVISGLSQWMDEKGYHSIDDFVGAAVPKVVDWQYLNLNHVTKARIDQDACIKCGRCYAACDFLFFVFVIFN